MPFKNFCLRKTRITDSKSTKTKASIKKNTKTIVTVLKMFAMAEDKLDVLNCWI